MKTWEKVAVGAVVVASFTLPIFRSGGRTGLTFLGWVINHTIFGPPIEYVPEEDYMRELEGVEIASETPQLASRHSNIPELMAFYEISEESATKFVNRGR